MSMVMVGIRRNKKLKVFLSESLYFLCTRSGNVLTVCGKGNRIGNLRRALKCNRVTVGRELTMDI